MRRATLSAVVAAALLAAPAIALETPRACSAADPRVRCIAYGPTQVVRLYAATGAALTVEFSEAETIVDASTSDNGLLEGGDASSRQAVAIAETGGTPGTADRNLMMAKRGSFLFLKPLRPLLPQPITVLTRREDGRVRRYTFQLETRPGGLTEDAPNTFFAVRFTYPADEAAARQARFQADRDVRQARLAAARLRQNVVAGETVRNARYRGQGTAEDRAALAPASTGAEPAIWDDGQRTFLRYPGNRRVPMVYQVLPDGRGGVVGQSADPDPTTNGTLLTLHGVFPMLRLRDGRAVLCIVNGGFDPTGQNPGTGTTNPDVVRELAPEGRPRVR